MAGWSDEIFLLKTPSTNVGGFSVPGTPERTLVFANKKSVARAEHYAAMAAGKRTDAIYEVHADDFDEHTEIEDDRGRVFTIIRSYQTTPDTVELTCARR